MVANIHGEMELVDRLLTKGFERSKVLAARQQHLKTNRDALYTTLLQYDADLDPASIGASEQWKRRYRLSGGARSMISNIQSTSYSG